MSIPGPHMLMNALFFLLRKTSGLNTHQTSSSDLVDAAAKRAIKNNEQTNETVKAKQKS